MPEVPDRSLISLQVHRLILAMWTGATFRPQTEYSDFVEVSGELKCHNEQVLRWRNETRCTSQEYSAV